MSLEFQWEAVLDSGVIVTGNPRAVDLRKASRPVRSLVVLGPIKFGIGIPPYAEPVIFTRHTVQLGTRIAEPKPPRLFVGWEKNGERFLWEFGRGPPKFHGRRDR